MKLSKKPKSSVLSKVIKPALVGVAFSTAGCIEREVVGLPADRLAGEIAGESAGVLTGEVVGAGESPGGDPIEVGAGLFGGNEAGVTAGVGAGESPGGYPIEVGAGESPGGDPIEVGAGESLGGDPILVGEPPLLDLGLPNIDMSVVDAFTEPGGNEVFQTDAMTTDGAPEGN